MISPRAWLMTLAGLLAAASATAQVHHLEDIPWHAGADSVSRRGAVISYHQYRDSHTGWRTDRLGLTFHLAVGEQAVFFMRGGFVRFDNAGLSSLDRWPWLPHEGDDSQLGDDWPGETMVNGFDRPEVGLVMPLALPWLGDGDLGFMAGLPVGRDELYPMSAACLPLAVDWRREVTAPGGVRGAVRAGFEHTYDSGREYLSPAAFPAGFRYGVELHVGPMDGRRLTLEWLARELDDGRHVRRARATALLPLDQGHVLAVELARDLGGRDQRYATWIAGVSWRLRALPAAIPERPGRGRSGGQNATSP